MTHTPGPWVARHHHIWTQDAPVHIAQIIRAPDGDWSPDNARLIAAAPALLEALEDMHSAMVWLIAQLPNDEKIADYNLDQAEAADIRAQTAIALARKGQ